MLHQLVRCALLLVALLHRARSERSSIVFEDADLSTSVQSEGRELHLDAFKAAGNDLLLQSKGTANGSRLQWFSLGQPRLDPRNASRGGIFDLKFDRVSVTISTLTAAHRKALAAAAQDKYGVHVSERQFQQMPLSSVKCEIKMRDDAGQAFLLIGHAINLQQYPIRVDFDAPRNSPARQLLQRLMQNDPDGLKVDCTFYAKGREVRINTLELSSERINQLGIVDELFGPGDVVDVTREQLVKLSNDMYSALSIMKEYEMPQHEFIEEFVNELLLQTASNPFSQVDVDDVYMVGLSSYAYENIVALDDIVEVLSSLYSVETVKNRRRIKFNGTAVTNTTIAALFSISIGPTSRGPTGDIVPPSLSLEDQVTVLNSIPESDVHWKIEGNRLVPKSLLVATLRREDFKKTLRFNRIFREITEAPFAHKVRMEIGDSVQRDNSGKSLIVQQQQEIAKLKSDVDRLTKLMQQQPKPDELRNLMEQLQNLTKQQQLHEEWQHSLQQRDQTTTTKALTEEQKNLIKEWETKTEKERSSSFQISGWWYNTQKPWTVLHSASAYGEAAVVQALIIRGDDVNAISLQGGANFYEHTPLSCASIAGHSDVVIMLLENGADVDHIGSSESTPLHWASYCGNSDVATLLLKNGADVNHKDNGGSTALHWASRKGKTDVVRLLIQNGADVNSKNNEGATPLHWASYKGYPGIVEVLIKAGAKIDEKDKFGQTPLHVASSAGRTGVVRVLLRCKADKNIKDMNGKTPSDFAGKEEIKQLLG